MHELSYNLLYKGYLTIGFSEFTSPEMIAKVRNGDSDYLNAKFRELWGEGAHRRKNALKNFLSMGTGDTVVVLLWGNFCLCKIIGEQPLVIADAYSKGLAYWHGKAVGKGDNWLYREDGSSCDLGFGHKVEMISVEISKAKFADAALSKRIKSDKRTPTSTIWHRTLEIVLVAIRTAMPMLLPFLSSSN